MLFNPPPPPGSDAMGSGGCFPGGNAAEASNLLPAPQATVDEWSFTTAPPCAFMECT